MPPWSAKTSGENGTAVADRARLLQDVWSDTADGAPSAFVAAGLAAGAATGATAGSKPVLWVQDRASRRVAGRPSEAGLRRAFGLRSPILHVAVGHPRDALRAMEEGAACAALGAVVGEVDADAPALDLVATKRLMLRAGLSGVAVWLIRSRTGRESAAGSGLSAARLRWRVDSVPSAAHPLDPAAPGDARWSARLVRAAGRAPGEWELVHDPDAPDRFRLAAGLADGALAAEPDEPARIAG